MSKKSSGEKKFGTSLFGFNKVDVNLYLESLIKSYNDNLWEKDSQINELKKKAEELQQSNVRLSEELNSISDTKENIANTFIKAQENANKMMEDARESAAMEKNKLVVESESIRELIIDKKENLKELRDAARYFGTDLNEIVKEYMNEFMAKVDEAVKEAESKRFSSYITDMPEEDESEVVTAEEAAEHETTEEDNVATTDEQPTEDSSND